MIFEMTQKLILFLVGLSLSGCFDSPQPAIQRPASIPKPGGKSATFASTKHGNPTNVIAGIGLSLLSGWMITEGIYYLLKKDAPRYKPLIVQLFKRQPTNHNSHQNNQQQGNTEQHNTSPGLPPSSKQELKDYLQNPAIVQEIQDLVQIGHANYTKNDSTLQTARNNAKANAYPKGAGRPGDWIEQTFGQTEDAILPTLRGIDGPKRWSIQTINETYIEVTHGAQEISDTLYYLVTGVGINYLHEAPVGRDGAIVQAASQFNYLESTSNLFVAPVGHYLDDKTQGPMASIEASAAAMYRRAAVLENKLPHALHQMLPNDFPVKYYENGYLMPYNITDPAEQTNILQNLQKHIQQLEILPQWVLTESNQATQLQLFQAAPSYQGHFTESKTTFAKDICTLLVVPQYKAIAQLAVIRSILINKTVNLHLTAVGQGAFNNPRSVYLDALRAVKEAIDGHNVRVFIHSYDPPNEHQTNELKNALQITDFTAEIERDEFMTGAFKQ